MEDPSQSSIYSQLLTFLKASGRQLDRQGGAERGLALSEALEFVGKLHQHKAPILGFEVWRKSGESYTLDHSEIWYPDPAYGDPYHDALATLRHLALDADDLVFIQF